MKNFYLITVIFSMFLSCQSGKEKEVASTEVWTDDIGNKVEIKKEPLRVLGLCSSSTELLAAICPEKVIGRTQTCNYPDFIQKLPVVNTYPLDVEGVLKLHPDFVLTLEGITTIEDAQRIENMGIPVFFQNFKTVDDVLKGIRQIGKICKADKKAEILADSLARLKDSLVLSNTKPKKRAINIIWGAPIYVHGYYSIMTDKMSIAGLENIIDSSFKKTSPEISREYLLSKNPALMFAGFADFEKDFFNLYPELRRLDCYKSKRLFRISEDLQSRPGPRIMEAIIELKNLSENAQ